MFFEDETKDTHGNMDDYDLDIEQGESVSWDKLLDDKEDLDEPAPLETEDSSDDDDIAEKLLNMDDDSFDAFVVKQQQNGQSHADSANSDNEINFDEFLLDDIDEETESALKKAVKNDLTSDNNYEPELLQEEETYEEDEDVFDFIQEDEENVQQVEPMEVDKTQNIQQEIAQINDFEEDDDEEEDVAHFLQSEDDEDVSQVVETYAPDENSSSQEQFAEQTPDVPALIQNNKENADSINADAKQSRSGNFAKKENANEPKKQNSSLTTVLLLVILLAAGGYYGYTNYAGKLNFGGGLDTSAEIGQDNSLIVPSQDEVNPESANPGASSEGPLDVATPPEDAAGMASAPSQVNAETSSDTQATKSVSKAVEQGRTKISKDKDKSKTSIQIVTTGRLNPFVPVGNLNNLGFITTPKIDILPPNETLGQADPLLDKLMSIKVSGILYDGVSSSAVINLDGVDYFVQKGDKIDSFTVVNITKTSVAIKEKNNIFSASIGQSFSGGAEINGQTQIQRHNNTIIRQYTTASDITVNPTGNQHN